MATYKEIFGKKIKVLANDPTDAGAEGQIWYNTTLTNFRTVLTTTAWSSSAPTITPVYAGGAAGPSTAGLAFGGTPASTATYEYNGRGWATVPAVIGSPRAYVSSSGAGSQTAALLVAGESPPPSPTGKTESYDGSSWTEETDMSNASDSGLGFGTQTAFINSGGVPGYPWTVPASTSSEEFNGSSWTAAPAVNNPRAQGGGLGIETAGLIFGGRTASPATSPQALVATTESYNGSAWTAENVMNDGRLFSSSGSGTQTAGVTAGGIAYPGGSPVDTNKTETYDGTSWTSSPATLATTRYVEAGSFGSGTSAVVFGGRSGGSIYDLTEEFNSSTSAVTAGAWASQPAMSVSRYGGGSGGTPTAAWYATGYKGHPGYTTATEEFNGSTWGAGGAITDTYGQSTGSAGTLTAGLKMGGVQGGTSTATEEYNGTSWTGVPGTLTSATSGTSGSGIQTAAIYTRGRPTTANESYNGTTWTAKTTISGTARSGTNSGTATAALFLGGEQPPGPYLGEVEEFNGTSWTTKGSLIIPQGGSSNSGPSTDAIVASGYTLTAPWGPGNITETQKFDGTAWATAPSCATARSSGGSSNRGTGGGSDGALVFAGNVTAVEEFTAETTGLNYKTITTS